jgi:hypothetical protein
MEHASLQRRRQLLAATFGDQLSLQLPSCNVLGTT